MTAKRKPKKDPQIENDPIPCIELTGSKSGTVFNEALKARLENALPGALHRYRWFGGKSRPIKTVTITETIPFSSTKEKSYIVLFTVKYTEGAPETYALPLMLAYEKNATNILRKYPKTVIFSFRRKGRGGFGIAYDATINKHFCSDLFKTLLSNCRLAGKHGDVVPFLTSHFRDLRTKLGKKSIGSQLLKAEQSNTSINYGNKFVFKLFRRLEEGVNPDVEIGMFLTDYAAFKNTPKAVGTMEYIRGAREPITLGSLHTFVPNQGDAWKAFMELLNRFCRNTLRKGVRVPTPRLTGKSYLEAAMDPFPSHALKQLQPFIGMAELLGRRTVEMHIALGKETDDELFAAEPFTAAYQRTLYQSLKQQTDSTLTSLANALDALPKGIQDKARKLINADKDIDSRYRRLIQQKIRAQRIRTHGDFHLGQVLYTKRGDFMIIDFEGEPARPLQDRKLKRSPLRDVAGMLRSFHYASHVAQTGFNPKETALLEPWLSYWHYWVCAAYMKGYTSMRTHATFLPESPAATRMLLDIYLLEKALYELVYEMNNRPDWVKVPLSGILALLEAKL